MIGAIRGQVLFLCPDPFHLRSSAAKIPCLAGTLVQLVQKSICNSAPVGKIRLSVQKRLPIV
jgi:hypothetical protein